MARPYNEKSVMLSSINNYYIGFDSTRIAGNFEFATQPMDLK